MSIQTCVHVHSQAKSIICGLEPQKTRSFLQLLCVAARTKGGVATAAAAATSTVRFSESTDGLTSDCVGLCQVSTVCLEHRKSLMIRQDAIPCVSAGN